MATYVLRRLIQAIPILIGISIISFLIVHLAPGEPDRPVPRRAACRRRRSRTSSGCTGSTSRCSSSSSAGSRPSGRSLERRRRGATRSSTAGPSPRRSSRRIPPTLLLMGTVAHRHRIVAIPLGILAAVKQYSWADKIITTLATIGYALPSFVLGVLLLYIFAIQLDARSRSSARSRSARTATSATSLWHLVLPVMTPDHPVRSPAGAATCARRCSRSCSQDYVRTAKAKGLRELAGHLQARAAQRPASRSSPCSA